MFQVATVAVHVDPSVVADQIVVVAQAGPSVVDLQELESV